MQKEVINNINDYLRIYKISQSDLARYLDVPRQTVSKILNGYRDIKIEELKKIADYFEIGVDELYRNEKNVHLTNKQILYHGSLNKKIKPIYKGGHDNHDYGNGFYLSKDEVLAKEWAVCLNMGNGYLHKFELDISNLKILYLNEKYNVLTWLAILAKHRNADTTKRYKVNVTKLIEKYYFKETEEYDVIVGYRADDSYFSFAKHAIKNEIDISLLEKIMKSGNLGYQVFIQSKKTYKYLKEIDQNNDGYYLEVINDDYFEKYNERDHKARNDVANLMNSDDNTLEDTLEKYL